MPLFNWNPIGSNLRSRGDPDERHKFAETILDELITSVGSTKADICNDGMLVLRLERDAMFATQNDLKYKMKQYSRKGFIPPV